MLIPYNTDAPIYHFPWATIGLIVVNCAVFVAMLSGQIEAPQDWILMFGDGLQPYQWLTSNFVHGGPIHLLGNMLFLWGFGLVVEGKLGWLKFLPIYLGIGVVDSAVVQLVMLSSKGGAFGASGVIFALLAMGLVWAPRNELSVFLLAGFRFYTFEMSILFFSTLYVILQIAGAAWQHFSMSSEVLHLSGAFWGFAVGIALLKFKVVDCENWDIFSVLAGREGKPPPQKPKVRDTAQRQHDLSAHSAAGLAHIQALLAKSHGDAALALHKKLSQTLPLWQLPERELLELIKVLQHQKQWTLSLSPMVEYLRRFPEKSARVRLKLAHVLIASEGRPAQALSVLAKIPPSALPANLAELRRQLERRAAKMRADGELEMDGEDW